MENLLKILDAWGGSCYNSSGGRLTLVNDLLGLWQDIVKAKYLRGKVVANVHCKFNDSPCWKALFKIKYTHIARKKVNLKNGSICRLWKGPVHDDIPLYDQFPILVYMCLDKDCTIKEVLDANIVVPFRRTLRGDNLNHWIAN
jgi:hypothetical protein